MDMHRLLSALLQLLVLIPGAVSCYLPVKKQMKYTPAKTAALCTAVTLPYSLATAFLHAAFSISMEALFFPALVLFFFLYRRTVDMDLSRALAVYVGVCAIETFPAQFAYAFDARLHPSLGAADFSPEAALFRLGLATLLLAAFFRPATENFSWALDRLDSPKLWYSTVALSSVFLVFNVLAVPRSYSTLYAGRMYELFLAFEAGAHGGI